MKREIAVFLLGCTLLLAAACAGLAASDPVPPADQPETQAANVEPEYGSRTITAEDRFSTEDGEELAHYQYVLPAIFVSNAEALSAEEAERAGQVADAYNGMMESLLEDYKGRGTAIYNDALEVCQMGELAEPYYDTVSSGGWEAGDILSNCMVAYTYTGGAHPNSYHISYLFDLKKGQFIDSTQLADDPEAFRAGVEALLLEKAEEHPERESFWEDYAGVIARWNEAGLQFDELGLAVIFSPYELGPYSCGEITLRLSWEELEPLLGPDGLARLGRTEAEQRND